ncbi:iron-sulfur cluster binding protein [Fimbriimonas ginsengisoli Gsoil 348]|uniref:Iron-sulfur cluster binding protein n=1 Tax=Fimbriimonas ginsengisoli Gsoil 348 TaxID=661478 RepID=A0A068NTV0_FIMGI|nr:iron-sulfur cluster binding protein [Fimbriimonas ginsengisoli Gsoil 348]
MLLKIEARRLGFELCGVAEAVEAPHLREYAAWLDKGYHGEMGYLREHLPIKAHPRALLPGVRSVIAVGLNYNQPNPPRPGRPRIARYALGRDYHRVLRGKLKKLAAWIEANHPGSECRACVDSAPVFERDYARLAGLGWFGKNTMLINSQRGSWFFIGLLLTTVEFHPDEAAVGACGTCRRCIDACPTGAIVFEEGRWQVDARHCISYLTIEHPGELPRPTGEWTFGCDVCQEVCPFNHPRPRAPLRAQVTEEPDFLAQREWPSLVELAELSYERWDHLTRGSAVRRTGIEGLRRNAGANLKNSDAS